MNHSVVKIDTNNKLLTKGQKEFNRLIKKIENTEKEIKEYRETADRLTQRVQKDLSPLRKQYGEQAASMVHLFDRAYHSDFFKKPEKKKIADWIIENAYELITQYGMNDLKIIYDKYDEDGFDASNEILGEEMGSTMRDMMSALFGIEVDEDADVSSPEKLEAHLQEKLAQKQTTMDEESERRRASQTKSKKQAEREEKQEIEARNITKTVRAIYMDLVKAFHPDRETDEAEKVRKTEIMHRITEAYEKNDLLALLRLQLEYNRIDKEHLDKLADDQLKYYNKILKEQAAELANELENLQMQLQAMTGRRSYYIPSPMELEYALSTDINALKKEIKKLKSQVNDLQDHDVLRMWLKSYKIKKASRNDGLEDILEIFMR